MANNILTSRNHKKDNYWRIEVRDSVWPPVWQSVTLYIDTAHTESNPFKWWNIFVSLFEEFQIAQNESKIPHMFLYVLMFFFTILSHLGSSLIDFEIFTMSLVKIHSNNNRNQNGQNHPKPKNFKLSKTIQNHPKWLKSTFKHVFKCFWVLWCHFGWVWAFFGRIRSYGAQTPAYEFDFLLNILRKFW